MSEEWEKQYRVFREMLSNVNEKRRLIDDEYHQKITDLNQDYREIFEKKQKLIENCQHPPEYIYPGDTVCHLCGYSIENH